MIRLSLCSTLIVIGSVAARAPDEPIAPGDAAWVSVQSTAPTVVNCGQWRAAGCFRTLLEIRGRLGVPVRVAFKSVGAVGGQMSQSQAYLASGTACEVRVQSGLLPTFWNEWTVVTRTRPARVIVDYYCDAPVRRGDSAFIDLSLWLAADGAGEKFQRFPFPAYTVK